MYKYLILTILILYSCNMKKTEIPEPRAEKIDKIMTIHDHQRIDEFYWLNERDNPKVIEYLNAENTYRDQYMQDYKNLEQTDLNKPIKVANDQYDAVMCVGTFTFGHVKPHALNEFIRITKNKGLICFTINEGIYEEYGFDKKIKELSDNNQWNVKEFFKSDYIASKDVNAWLGLAEVIKK